jgi:hypothetical protein
VDGEKLKMPIYQKILQVMKAVHGVEKASKNSHANYKYAGHEAVTAALRDEFVRLGIVRHPTVVSHQSLPGGVVEVVVKVRYVDTEDGSEVESTMPALQHCQTKNGSITAQQIGQALSYAIKNIEFKLFALTGDAEADTDSTEANRYVDRGSYDAPDREGDYEDAAHADVQREAKAMLAKFSRTKNAQEVVALNKECRQHWARLKSVKGLAEDIVKAREAALKRLRANGHGEERQPGAEG